MNNSKATILIVDDEKTYIDLLAGILSGNYSIVIAKSGEQALKRLQSENLPDLILLDIMMPGMDGYEVCRRLKDDQKTGHIPILFITALSEIDEETKGIALGAVDFITKPINPSIVRARVKTQIDLKLHRDNLEAIISKRTAELKASEEGYRSFAQIGRALSVEKNNDKLLEMILDEARNLTKADAGTLYLVDDNKQFLNFKILCNNTKKIQGANNKIMELPKIPLFIDGQPNYAHVSSYSALTGKIFNIEDVSAVKEFDFAGFREYDEKIGYRTKSMLVIPMQNYEGEIIGVLQLINSQDEDNHRVIPFTAVHEDLTASLASQAAVSIENARLYENLEQKVEERTLELNQALGKIMKSIRYAERIQRSLLPNPEDVKTYLPDSFFLWMPRDIVGGDIYFTERFEDGIIIAVIDCTGHGVPGAFMSMIASSFIRRITTIANCHDPAEILKQLNSIIKTSLQQDRKDALSDDGLDAAICFIEMKGEGRETREVKGEGKDAGNKSPCPSPRLIFAGAKLPLFYIHNSEVTVIKGDKQSIGYKRSDPNFGFTNHTIRIEKGMSFYMSTDGFWSQLGGERRFSFGQKRFRSLLKEVSYMPFEEQCEILVQRFNEYKDIRQDDVTVAGFGNL
ncbi:MAG: response regulator [Desulfobacterales bacterium]|nr:response regulator [Desulfobacterales bacterium]